MTPEFDAPTSLRGVHVLLVGGDAEHVAVLKEALWAAHALVIVCASSAEALGVMERLRVDVLLVDIDDLNDEQRRLIENVRALPREEGGDTPAVVLSRHTADRDELLAAGFQAHLVRPVNVQDLCRALLTLARR